MDEARPKRSARSLRLLPGEKATTEESNQSAVEDRSRQFFSDLRLMLDRALVPVLGAPRGRALLQPTPTSMNELGLVELFERSPLYDPELEDALGGPEYQLNEWWLFDLQHEPSVAVEGSVLSFDWGGSDSNSVSLLSFSDDPRRRGYLYETPYEEVFREEFLLYGALEPFDDPDLLSWMLARVLSIEEVANVTYPSVPTVIEVSPQVSLDRDQLMRIISAMACTRHERIEHVDFFEAGGPVREVRVESKWAQGKDRLT